MTVYLSHISALEFWAGSRIGSDILAQRKLGKLTPSWSRRASLPDEHPLTASEIQRCSDQIDTPLSKPVHSLVCRPESRTRWRGAICHVNSKPLPRGSLIRVSDKIFISSPELCFVQMATELPLSELIKLGCELGGTYGIPTIGHIDYSLKHSYTTFIHLERFLKQANILPGSVKARKAFAHIVFNSASPMETLLVMLLCLPLRMGGYGLPKPYMNRRIVPQNRSGFVSNTTCYYCDLLWPDAAVALEYDSFEFHGTCQAHADDAKRRTELFARNIVVISVTGRTVRNLLELDTVARTLAKRLHVRLRNNSESWRSAQHKLQGTLLTLARESERLQMTRTNNSARLGLALESDNGLK